MSDFSTIGDWARTLDDAPDKVARDTRRVMRWAGQTMSEFQRAEAPVRTGETADTVGFDVDDDGMGVTSGTESWWAPMVEAGTPRASARPFIFPALDLVETEAADRLADAATGALE